MISATRAESNVEREGLVHQADVLQLRLELVDCLVKFGDVLVRDQRHRLTEIRTELVDVILEVVE